MAETSNQLLQLCDVAVAAGALILDVYARAEIAWEPKADNSPVTVADLKAERLILDRLSVLWPGMPIVSEEAAASGIVPAIGEQFFLIDPLDGTKEFLSRNGEFTVNIALIEGEKPAAGVVYAPATGALYAGDGSGAWKTSMKSGRVGEMQAIRVRAPGGKLAVLASRSHMTPETEAFIRKLSAGALVQAGSSLKFCRVAEGAADIYPRFGRTMEWDTAAGDAVLRAAGGCVVTKDGAPLAYGKRDFENPSFIASGSRKALDGILPC